MQSRKGILLALTTNIQSGMSSERCKDVSGVSYKIIEKFYKEKIFLTHKKFKSIGMLEKNRDYVEKNLTFQEHRKFFLYSSNVDRYREETQDFLRI